MAFKIIRDVNNRHQTGREIVAILDTDADLNDLGNAYAPGSIAIVAKQGGNTYMTNASGEWAVRSGGSTSGGGSGLPSGAKPNQYIVTDGEGNAKWEDKIAWSEKEVRVLFSDNALSITGTDDRNHGMVDLDIDFLTVGQEYTVVYNGVEYIRTAFDDGGCASIGNLHLSSQWDEDSGEPFYIQTSPPAWGGGGALVVEGSTGVYSVELSTVVEDVHPIDKKYLSGNTIFFVQSTTPGQGDAFLYRTEDGANNYDYAQRVSKSELKAAFFAGAISVKDISIEFYFMPSFVRFDRQWGEMMVNESFVCLTAEYVEEDG